MEEKLEKNAKAFIKKINNYKKNLLAKINKKHEKFTIKLKNEIEKLEMQKKLKLDEYHSNNNYNNYNNIYGNNLYNNNNNNIDNYNFNNYSNFNSHRQEEYKNSPDNSNIKNNNRTKITNKKYYHYSPYGYNNPKMLRNLSKDLLNFNSALYYDNNIPDIIQYQSLLVPLYRNNNMIYSGGSMPLLNIEEIDTVRNNNQDIIDITNGDIAGNTSKINNYSYRNDDTVNDNNAVDYSFNKKHLYYFNEPKYEMELTNNGVNETEKTREKIKNYN
jgi:hypothetical protein